MDVGSIIPVVSAIATFLLGITAGYVKYRKAKALLKEVGEAFTVVYNALADDKITEDEVKQILKEFEDVYEVLKRDDKCRGC